MHEMNIKKSVREFVELIMKSGSLDNRLTTNARAMEGIKAHQKLQKSNEKLYDNYEKEVALKINFKLSNYILTLEGRCDGIIIEGKEVIVEEIKSTYKPLIEINQDYNELHWAQAKVYAYILSKEKDYNTITVQLSYYNLDSDEVKSFRKKYSIEELQRFLDELIERFSVLAELEATHKQLRNKGISNVEFPFNNYRKGQLELVKACYGTIRDEKILFAQAPTGIGKTISTIFSSIKALSNGMGEKIFYLTAKNVNKKVAEDTFDLLREKGIVFRTVSIVAKEKICLNDKVACNPDECEYARDYYSKMNTVLLEILKNEMGINRDVLEKYAKEYKICPFELSLDLIEWSDGVIGDYNYIFDPKVYLRRVIDESENDAIVLVDEAHNLVNRSREMYTARLKKSMFMSIIRKVRGKNTILYRQLNKVNKMFIEERNNCNVEEKDKVYTNELPKELCKALRRFVREAEELLVRKDKVDVNDELLELYFECNKFLSISEQYGSEYVTYVVNSKDDVEICLFCVNPSQKLRNTMDKCRATILFSATLSPFEYYIKMLGGNIEDYRLKLGSPFKKENLKVYISLENIKYTMRDITLDKVCNRIMSFIDKEKGNYMVFFPSYEYMNKAYSYISKFYNTNNILIQKADMTEEEKQLFLNEFSYESNVIGFCVIGGIFSEGIDLPGKKLIGSIVVGVGYPKITFEGEIIKEFFKEDGIFVSYIYPGINKVMQAVGRVIRTEQDEGRVLLIDSRYNSKIYLSLLPDEWKPLIKI